MSRVFVHQKRPPRPCETCPTMLPADAGRRRRFCDRCREARHPGPKGAYHTMCQHPGCKNPLPDKRNIGRKFCAKCSGNRHWRLHYNKKRQAELAVRPPRICAGFREPCTVELPNAMPPGQRGRLRDRCDACAKLYNAQKAYEYAKVYRVRFAHLLGSFGCKGRAQDYLFKYIAECKDVKLRSIQAHGAKRRLDNEAVAYHLGKLVEDGYVTVLDGRYRLA